MQPSLVGPEYILFHYPKDFLSFFDANVLAVSFCSFCHSWKCSFRGLHSRKA